MEVDRCRISNRHTTFRVAHIDCMERHVLTFAQLTRQSRFRRVRIIPTKTDAQKSIFDLRPFMITPDLQSSTFVSADDQRQVHLCIRSALSQHRLDQRSMGRQRSFSRDRQSDCALSGQP